MQITLGKDSFMDHLDFLLEGSVIYLNEFGQLHREDGPALVNLKGKYWFLNGKRHRLDGPAVEEKYFTKWYFEGLLHRDGGPAVIDMYNGQEVWYRYGRVHRVGGPAVIGGPAMICSEAKEQWKQNDLLHREDGPAIINVTGRTWFFHGEKILWENHSLTQSDINLGLSKEGQEFLIKIRPDLIRRIPVLDPELREKYAHELSLSGLDI